MSRQSHSTPGPSSETRGLRSAIALAVGVFAVGTGEFVLAGLLPVLMDSFQITAAEAGQIVTVFAISCALAAPLLTTVTVAWPRRTVLITATLTYLAGAVGTAIAPTYELVLLAQIVSASGVGLFIPSASVTAAALVPAQFKGRAIAIVVSGFTAAVSLGAPLGTALGGAAGWRATMWFTAALAIVGMIGVLFFVPKRVQIDMPRTLSERLRPLGDRQVLALLATTLIGFTAVFIPYTYLGIIFSRATAGSSAALAILMFTLGVVGAVGNLGAGFVADRIGGNRVVAIALVWLAASTAVLPLTAEHFGAAIAAIAFYAIAAFAITTPQQHRLMLLQPAAASILLSLNQAVLYLAIALSGIVGGVAISWIGEQQISLVAALLAVAALGTSVLASRKTDRSTGTAPLR